MPTPQPTTKDISQERLLSYAVNGAYYGYMSGYAQYLQSLPRHVDDIERDFGLDIYKKMLHDSAVSSSVNSIKTDVLSSGVRLTGRIAQPAAFKDDPEALREYEQSEQIKGEVEDMLDGLQQPIEEILDEMLDCLAYGHTLAEKVYTAKDGKLMLSTLRVKPRTRYSFIANAYMDVLGAVPVEFAAGMMEQFPEQGVPREKIFLLSFGSKGGDPRGQSILRPAYNWWYLKQQICPHYLKYLVQFATPSLLGILPEGAGEIMTGEVNPDGTPVTKTAETAMVEALEQFQNASTMAMGHGGDVRPIQVAGNGEAYLEGFNFFDAQITRAIVMSARALMEAEHGSKADSDSSQDVKDKCVSSLRRKVETSFYRDVIFPTVRYNYGADVAKRFAPVLTLADVAQEDLVAYGNMIANLTRGGYLHESQYPGIDAKLGLPERDMEAMETEKEQRQASSFITMPPAQDEEAENDAIEE
jgi:hypothetical protein